MQKVFLCVYYVSNWGEILSEGSYFYAMKLGPLTIARVQYGCLLALQNNNVTTVRGPSFIAFSRGIFVQ